MPFLIEYSIHLLYNFGKIIRKVDIFMRRIKKYLFIFLGILCTMYSACFGIGGVMILIKGEFFKENGLIWMIIAFISAVMLGLIAFKCFKKALCKGNVQSVPKEELSAGDDVMQDSTVGQSVTEAVLNQEPVPGSAVEVSTPQEVPGVSQAVSLEKTIEQKPIIGTELGQNNSIVNVVHRAPSQDGDTDLLIKNYGIPDDVKELLWIKEREQTFEHNLLKEPSLLDMTLEVRFNANNPIQDIGYYPSYRGLKPENRYIYLNWLRNVTSPVPIGYVFIFYYGLERHLIFGKFEQAFDMIVKLRMYHNNNSFNAYSADALLIAALYHKRPDLIGKIDLNKATPKLAQFVIASLTGRLESDLLIENCGNVGFTNKRYIKSDYNLYVELLNEVLSEKFGDVGYPIERGDFLKCKETFPLVLANYSLKTEERIANAPDLDTNEEFRKNVFALLSEAHEKVKEYKKIMRSRKNNA